MDGAETTTDRMDRDELGRIVTRLVEVRRRFVAESGGSARFDRAERRLGAIIGDLERAVEPDGPPVERDDLELHMAAVEEMIEGLGFPKYARVLASVRETLARASAAEATAAEDEPPPPRRFVPKPTVVGPGHPDGGRATPVSIAAAPPRAGRRLLWGSLALVVIVAGGLSAALTLGFVPFDVGAVVRHADEPVVAPAGDAAAPASKPPTSPDAAGGASLTDDAVFRETARSLGELMVEIEAAESALGDGDVDAALRHFAAAAVIDRHHRGVVGLAESLIDALLERADEAFDDARWQLAEKRIEDARHLADGLYLDTSAIELAARRHAAMTRFRDLSPVTRGSVREAEGRAVRVTLSTGTELFGRLVVVEGDDLVMSIHSGVHGGGVEFDKRVAVRQVAEIRIYDASRIADVVR